MGGRWRFVWGRSWIEREAVREADRIMREATRADAETMRRVVDGLREQDHRPNSTQAEVDAVIERWMAAHPNGLRAIGE